MSDVRSCGQCGAPLPDDSPHGVCPSCLMQLGLGADIVTGTQTHQAPRQSFKPPKPHELSVHFPQLEILDLIGQGGMGAVYKARQVGLDRIVALKILPPHAGDDGSFAERFGREARALARLSHPNIVGVYDSGRAGDFYYFVMEYVDGVNLREAIGAETLAPAEALTIVPQLCDALQYAHDEGIVHRDIKPENVLIDKKGNTKIADFGLARLLGTASDHTLTGTHQVMGTPRDTAPEQMEGSHQVDHRADIYSLGVVFYEMLTGELPLGRFDAPSKKVRLDVRLDEVVFRTLEKEPERRYQHASDIKDDVQTICGNAAGIPLAAPQHSFEFKSKARLCGWPLVHIAYGTNPETGKLHRAKGVIAMGNIAHGAIAVGSVALGGIAVGPVAIGGLAIGGGAVGSLALGGGAVGLFAFGGIAIGLLVAMGGLALGLGLSIGGLTVGAVAQGGLALGWYADAGNGAAYGMHALGNNVAVRDPQAERLFAFLTEQSPLLTFIAMIAIATVTLGVGMLVSLRILRRKKERHHVEQPPKMEPTRPGLSPALVAALVILTCLAAMCLLPIIVLTWMYSSVRMEPSMTIVQEETSEMPLRNSSASDNMQHGTTQDLPLGYSTPEIVDEGSMSTYPPSVDWIIWTADGPTLNPIRSNAGKRLTPPQLASMNQILADAHAAYIALEQKDLKQEKNSAGHWVTTVNIKDSKAMAELENEIWTQIDAVVDVSWQELLRATLPLKPSGDTGVLGFAEHQGVVEIWKVGSWFHWIVKSRGSGGAGYSAPGMMGGSSGFSGQGYEHRQPELPFRYRRFWIDPSEEVGTDAAATPVTR